MRLHLVPALRRLVLPLLWRFNPGDVTIRHAFTGDRMRIHSFRHRGYWFHGRRREAETMELIAKLVRPGQVVLDAGGHVGFLALHFAGLVGPSGRVVVFEPALVNLPYVRANLAGRDRVELVEAAVGHEPGRQTLWMDDLSGENSSLVRGFGRFEWVRDHAFVPEASLHPAEVEVVSLDAFCAERGLVPDFVKLDIEGGELEALRGARRLLERTPPRLMVETQREHGAVFELLRGAGYRLFDPLLREASRAEHVVDNTFALHAGAHAEDLSRLDLRPRRDAASDHGAP